MKGMTVFMLYMELLSLFRVGHGARYLMGRKPGFVDMTESGFTERRLVEVSPDYGFKDGRKFYIVLNL